LLPQWSQQQHQSQKKKPPPLVLHVFFLVLQGSSKGQGTCPAATPKRHVVYPIDPAWQMGILLGGLACLPVIFLE
jgi:hypothetical protein